MNHQKSLIVRVFIGIALIYAGWTFGVRPAHAKLDSLKQSIKVQDHLISQAGADFDAKRIKTNEANQMVYLAGQHVFDAFGADDEQRTARELIESHARSFGVAINRIEPLRMTEFTNAPSRSRYKKKTSEKKTKSVRFIGEGIRVELDGSFADIVGFIADIETSVQTIKLENFRMISSRDKNVRMIAQFVNFDLVESPVERVGTPVLTDSHPESEG
ncbi:MAG: hypothetical protein JKY96_06155 [Phycisphaerales bacterium]|nr:hypothetical protein [Phycisphaerales bacterium]